MVVSYLRPGPPADPHGPAPHPSSRPGSANGPAPSPPASQSLSESSVYPRSRSSPFEPPPRPHGHSSRRSISRQLRRRRPSRGGKSTAHAEDDLPRRPTLSSAELSRQDPSPAWILLCVYSSARPRLGRERSSAERRPAAQPPAASLPRSGPLLLRGRSAPHQQLTALYPASR
ncbi:ESX-1 secretion-associated protein EspI-like [Sciurus carolinensis]|uniref:ESX-1 secretion-associated protein EspI-like n=1 Tax=Sciurus carolinensis TaxID=30640 RepID=UPI001FB3AAD1|nr:ESX-1 secretion-associated protein EspI-like [Sciurus carolinensis]